MSARTLRTRLVWLVGVAVLALAAGLIIGWAQVGQGTAARHSVSVAAVTATPKQVEPIEVLTIGTTLHNASVRLDDVTVELDVYDAMGAVVLHERQSGVGISGDTTQAVYWVWRIPQRLDDGAYVVGISVYDTASKSLLASDDEGASFVVARTTPR